MDMKNLEKAIAYESSKGGSIKKCPSCGKEIQDEAIKCKNCGEMLKNDSNQVRISKPPKPKPNEMFKDLKWHEIIVACWPLVLIAVGGAIGGGFGGLACALNFKIFNAKLSKPLKYIYSILIGIGGILLYLVVVTVLVAIFPNIFNKK